MPAGKLYVAARRGRGRPPTLRIKKWGKIYKPHRRGRGGRRVRRARGLTPLTIPIKVGYTYDVIGTGTSSVNFDSTVSMANAPIAWFTRYEPIFEYIRINKCAIEISCPYNIGQHNVGTQALYQMWYKRAFSTAETPPGDIAEWLNMQSAKKAIFAGRKNTVDLYFTPGFEEVVQPINTAVTQLKLLYRRWTSIVADRTKMVPHIGFIGQIHRLDGSIIGNTNVFKVNVTLYCDLKGIKQL